MSWCWLSRVVFRFKKMGFFVPALTDQRNDSRIWNGDFVIRPTANNTAVVNLPVYEYHARGVKWPNNAVFQFESVWVIRACINSSKGDSLRSPKRMLFRLSSCWMRRDLLGPQNLVDPIVRGMHHGLGISGSEWMERKWWMEFLSWRSSTSRKHYDTLTGLTNNWLWDRASRELSASYVVLVNNGLKTREIASKWKSKLLNFLDLFLFCKSILELVFQELLG